MHGDLMHQIDVVVTPAFKPSCTRVCHLLLSGVGAVCRASLRIFRCKVLTWSCQAFGPDRYRCQDQSFYTEKCVPVQAWTTTIWGLAIV